MKKIQALLSGITLVVATSSMASVVPLATPATVGINFDGTGAPCNFSSTTSLTSRYTANGVTFSNNLGNAWGGAILNQCGGFGFSGHSGTDFLAYNTNSYGATDAITMTFGGAVGTVSIWAADYLTGANLLMRAYDASGNLVSSASVIGSRTWQQLTVSGSSISAVVLSGGRIGGFDDLSFTAATPSLAEPAGVPEPGVLALVGLGLLGVAVSRRRTV